MSDSVKIALIIAGGLIASVSLYLYFSPYQTCVRAETAYLKSIGQPEPIVELAQRGCADNSN